LTREIRLIAGGDVMLGEHPAMVGRGVSTRMRRNASYNPLAGITPFLRQADLSIANLESVLSDWSRDAPASHRECRAPTTAIRTLAGAGFRAFTLANNHIQQHGQVAVCETIAALARHDIAAVGLAGRHPGTCRPVDLECQGLPLRLLGYSLRPRQHFSAEPIYAEGTPEGILADVADGEAAGAIVVANLHWGDEFVAVPSRQQVSLGRAMIEAGCSLVLGHHPHVLQGWERYRHGAIFYSLGNLVFDMPWLPALRRTALCECTLTLSGCSDVVIHPLYLDDEHCPQPATEPVRAEILQFLADAHRQLRQDEGPLAAPVEDDYQDMVAAELARERWARNRYFLRNLWRYRPDVAGQLVGKFLLRRLGLLHD
jgi:poly-gamma-glutamate synthesis protein (capsule biosynthesis protein)